MDGTTTYGVCAKKQMKGLIQLEKYFWFFGIVFLKYIFSQYCFQMWHLALRSMESEYFLLLLKWEVGCNMLSSCILKIMIVMECLWSLLKLAVPFI